MARTRQTASCYHRKGLNYMTKVKRIPPFKIFSFSPKFQPKEKTAFPIPKHVSFPTLFFEMNFDLSIYTLMEKCFQNLPKDFILITPSKKEYLINKIIVFHTSNLIKKLIEENPSISTYQLQTNDCDDFIAKFSNILSGKSEKITKDDAKIAKKISKELKIDGFPLWMKPKKQRLSSSTYRNQLNRKPPKFSIISISSTSFLSFLKYQKNKQFYTIKTQSNSYQVPLFGAFCSSLISEQYNLKQKTININDYIINNNNNKNSNNNDNDNNNNDNDNDNKDNGDDNNDARKYSCFEYDFEDSNKEFEVIANFMSGGYYNLDTGNMDVSLKFTKDLGINELYDVIQKLIEKYNQRNNLIQENLYIMDDVNFLRSQILRFREPQENLNLSCLVKDVFNKLLDSIWCKDTEHVKEMVVNIVRFSSIYYKIVDQISQLFVLLDQAKNEREPLKILIPTLLDDLFCNAETPNNTANIPIPNSIKYYRTIKAQLILQLKKRGLITSKEIVFMIGGTKLPLVINGTKLFGNEKDFASDQIHQNPNYPFASSEISLSQIHFFFSPEIQEVFPNCLPETCVINDAQRFIEGEEGSLMNVIFNDDFDRFKEIESSTPNFSINQTIFCPNYFNFIELSLIEYAAEVDSPKVFNYIISKFDKSYPQKEDSNSDSDSDLCLCNFTSEFLRNVDYRVLLYSMGKSRSIIQPLLPYIDDIIKEREYLKEILNTQMGSVYHFNPYFNESPMNDLIEKSRPLTEYMDAAVFCHDNEMLEYFSKKSNQYLLCKSLFESIRNHNIDAFVFLNKQIVFLHDQEKLNYVGSVAARYGYIDFFIFLSKVFDINKLVGNFCDFQFPNNVGQNELSVFDGIVYSDSIRLLQYILENCPKAKSYSLSTLMCQAARYEKYDFIEYCIKDLKQEIIPKEIEYIISNLYLYGKPEIAKLIFDNYPIPDQQIFYFIEVAAAANDIDFLSFLVDKQLKIDPKSTFKDAFNAAAKYGNLEICQYIASIHSEIPKQNDKNNDNNNENDENQNNNENQNKDDNDNNNDTGYKFEDSSDDDNNNDEDVYIYNPIENLEKTNYKLTITMIIRYVFMYSEKSNFYMKRYFYPASRAIEILRLYFAVLRGDNLKGGIKRALRESISLGINEIAEFLLSYNVKDKGSFVVAARNGMMNIVQKFIEIDQDKNLINSVFNNYGSAINAAIETGRTEIVNYLLSFPNIDLKSHDYYHMTPLSTSVFYRRYDIFEKIIKTGKFTREELNEAFLFYCRNTKKVQPFISPTAPTYFSLTLSPKANNEEIQTQEVRTAQMLVNCQITNEQLRTVFPNIIYERSRNGLNCFTRPLKSDLFKLIEEDERFIDYFFNSEESKKLIDFNFYFLKETFLIAACKFGRYKLVKLLLQQPETNVNIYDDKGDTPLIHSVAQGHFSIVQLLCEERSSEININQNNFFKRTAFTFAATTNRLDILKYLSTRKGFNSSKSQVCTAAAASIILGYKEITQFLLEKDIKSGLYIDFDVNKVIVFNHLFGISDPSIKQSVIQMPCFNSFNNNNPSMQRNRVIENSTWSLLRVAVQREDVEAIKIIANHPRFNINESNADRALFYATKSNNLSVFKIMLKISNRDINFNYKGKECRSLLCTAVTNKADKIIKYIINHPQFDPVKSQSKIAFYTSLLSQPLEIVELCSTIKGIDFNGRCPKIPQELFSVSYGQFYNRNVEGMTPLYIASMLSIDILNFFLNMGNKIDVNCRNEDGSTPIFGAIQNQMSLDLLLQQKGVDVNAQDNNGRTVLMQIVLQRFLQCAPIILTRDDVDLSIKDKEGKNALMYANPDLSNIDPNSLSWKELSEIFAQSVFSNQDFY